MTKKKEHKKVDIEFLIYLFLFTTLMIFGLIAKRKGANEIEQLKKYGVKTVGEIYFIQKTTRGTWVKYFFQVQNKTYKGTDMTYTKYLSVGQKYEVVYLPSDPNINRMHFKIRIRDIKLSPDKHLERKMFSEKETFKQLKSDSLNVSGDKSIPEGSTYNLMDYPPVGGQVLLKPQTICYANINQYFVKLCQSSNLQISNLLIIS